MNSEKELNVGYPRGAKMRRTLDVFQAGIQGLSPMQGQRVLDVGCGDGTFTIRLTAGFEEIVGIDVQDSYLDVFRSQVGGNPKFRVLNMSASEMEFPDQHFDTILTLETLEHIPLLEAAVAEFARVLRPGGEVVLSVPNRWFPFENHGCRFGTWEFHGRVPLLTYLPWLHDRHSIARVFKVKTLDRLFGQAGMRRTHLGYLWPTFEHGDNFLQPLIRPLFGVMRLCERSPIRMFGTSIIARYVRE